MSKVAMVADVHVANHRRFGGAIEDGLNRRGRECIDALTLASKLAAKRGAQAFVVLGDLFDHTRPTPQLVHATSVALLAGGLPVYVLLGNHDAQSPGALDHACVSMSMVPGIQVIWQPERIVIGDDIECLMVPYHTGQASDWFPLGVQEAMRGAQRKGKWKRVVMTHLGIWDQSTPPFLKAAHDAIGLGQVRFVADAHDIDAVFAGNWHSHKYMTIKEEGGGPVVIPGTLVPAGFQEADPARTGRMSYYSSDGSHHEQTVDGPRWHTVDLRTYDGLPPSFGSPGTTYVRVLAPREKMTEAVDFKTAFEAKGWYAVIDPVGADKRLPEITRMAVAAAGGQLDDSFAELAKVEEPGTKEGVLARLSAYRKAHG